MSKTARIFGFLIFLLSCSFLLWSIWKARFAISDWHFPEWTVAAILGSASACVLGCILLAWAWCLLLRFFGQSDARFVDCLDIYARSNIARYLPGNLFHLVGRQVAGGRKQYGQAAIAGASLYEIVGVLASTSLLAILGFLQSRQDVAAGTIVKLSLLLLAAAVFPLIFNKALSFFSYTRHLHIAEKVTGRFLKGLSLPFTLYVGYIAILVGTFTFLMTFLLGGKPDVSFGYVMMAFSTAVVLGFITPGAPGGIGVREAVLVGFLSFSLGQTESLVAALTMRMATITGDLLFYFVPALLNLLLKGRNR